MSGSHHQLRKRGLYDPRFEHDACGIGFVARLSGAPSHSILHQALTAVGNMVHRGAVAADGKSGDGAGVMTQIPRQFFARELELRNIRYPVDALAVGMIFLPRDAERREQARTIINAALRARGLAMLGWRVVPVDLDALGGSARATCPAIEQVLVGRGAELADSVQYERALYLARRAAEAGAHAAGIDDLAIPSLSSRTLIYKGLMTAPALSEFYADLRDPQYETAIAVYHQRYSTNTMPTWERAQPFHMISHNGEINTVWGNVQWMQARAAEWRRAAGETTTAQAVAQGGPALACAVAELGPIIDISGSDSAMLDNAAELLTLGGRDVRHTMAMLVPEAWERVQDMDPTWRAFYQYHAGLVEPWDGPAALAFCDGEVVGLALDRNGLRPARFLVTDDGLVVCGSEMGAVQIDDARVVRKGKVGPGQMIAADLRSGRFEENTTIKSRLAAAQPYAAWLAEQMRVLPPAASARVHDGAAHESGSARDAKSALLGELQRAFGYTSEELTVVLRPMARDGAEPIGSMGDDTATALLADRPRPLYNSFKQRFAEVTNPPIDPIREELVMSLGVALGRRGDLLAYGPQHAHLIRIGGPVLSDEQLETIRALSEPAFAPATIRALFRTDAGAEGMSAGLDALCRAADNAVATGAVLLIISDRGVSEEFAPIPAAAALGAVHQHLSRTGLRTRVSLIVESGEPREVHHVACLIGLGAEAVNPYLGLATVRALATEREDLKKGAEQPPLGPEAADEAEHNFIHALEKGLLKIMSKMGVATVDSYCGAQLFEIVGLGDDIVVRCFDGVPARLGGLSLRQIARGVLEQHDAAFANRLPLAATRTTLPHPGYYKFKKDGETHTYSPAVVHALQKAAGGGSYDDYRAYSKLVHARAATELRDLLTFVPGTPVPLDEVESVAQIAMRFSTAAMSHGSTSSEAHETLAVAMSRLGGLSNSGEGGEDPARYADERNSTIKQVASGRFGVTPAYLMSARELQIKMAQGSKPGEGGQIPGAKVTEEVARNRFTTPGVSLISPPPHHDIYSIEDLSQLIYDLQQVNPQAAISVKLVAEVGVGTIAAGVAKGGADVVQISGHSGGTGASPLSSIKNAGVNWELGLAETQHTLVINGLRGRVRVRVDGGLKTGRDVVQAALLGADEFSFGTAALVAEGCVMARACHNNTCPVGIATQRPELRAKFTGTPEHVVHFFSHLAQEVREVLAELGFRSIAEAVGRSDRLAAQPRGIGRVAVDVRKLIERVDEPGQPIRNTEAPAVRPAGNPLNAQIISETTPAVARGVPVALSYPITNVDRSIGATLAGAIAQRHGGRGLASGTITLTFRGSAGQSFGAFMTPGVRMVLHGESNDYVGKGMAGGEIIVRPGARARFAWHESAIIGNTCIYGATGGALFAAGRAGERFAVRNSGGVAVVEGLGDHGCEYMTGGVVLVLGTTGRNFAAGMTGGTAYILDEDGNFPVRCNGEMVELARLGDEDEADVQALLQRHRELTSSPRAGDILARWGTVRHSFWRVQPRGLGVVRLSSALPLAAEWVRV